MGRAFEYRKAAKLKRWGHMAKTFTKIGKQIAIAVKAGGPEPDMNPALRAIIANAKRENMPKDNIERAIKNAMGKDQSDYKEVNYEGYGPHGIAIFVETLTDNTTRTVGDVRSVFNKFNGNLGTQGSLSFLFDHKAVFTFKKKDGLDMDEMILDLIDYGVEDEYDDDDLHRNGGRGLGAQLPEQHFVDGLYPPSALFDVAAIILLALLMLDTTLNGTLRSLMIFLSVSWRCRPVMGRPTIL